MVSVHETFSGAVCLKSTMNHFIIKDVTYHNAGFIDNPEIIAKIEITTINVYVNRIQLLSEKRQ